MSAMIFRITLLWAMLVGVAATAQELDHALWQERLLILIAPSADRRAAAPGAAGNRTLNSCSSVIPAHRSPAHACGCVGADADYATSTNCLPGWSVVFLSDTVFCTLSTGPVEFCGVQKALDVLEIRV